MPDSLWKKILGVLTSVLTRKIEALISALYIILLSGAVLARDYLAQFVPHPADQWAVLTTGAALAGILTAGFSYFWFRPKLWFDEVTNTYIDRKTGIRYCAQCKHAENKHTPLGIVNNGWECSIHKRFLPDPERPFSEKEPHKYPTDYPGY